MIINIKNLSVRKKLILGYTCVIIPFVIVSAVLLVRIMKINKESKRLSSEYLVMLDHADHIETDINITVNALQAFVQTNNEKRKEEGIKFISSSKESLDTLGNIFEKADSKDEIFDCYKSTALLFNEFYSLSKAIWDTRDSREETFSQMYKFKDMLLDNLKTLRDIQDQNVKKHISLNQKAEALNAHKLTLDIDEYIAMVKASVSANALKTEEGRNKIISDTKIIIQACEHIKDSQSRSTVEKVHSASEGFLKLSETFVKTYQKSGEYFSKSEVVSAELINLSHALKMNIATKVEDISSQINGALLAARHQLILALFVVALLIIFIGYQISRHITKPLGNSLLRAVKLSEGDLSVEFKRDQSSDEIGLLQNAMSNLADNLNNIVSNITNEAKIITDASMEMSRTSSVMNDNANDQAASVQEVSSSIQEMTSSIQKNSDNAHETEKIALNNFNSIKNCSEIVHKTINTMNHIAQKISVVDEIAFQTNILALNAAVEAARAGEHGKGFAVVAGEVRKLAEKCAISAREIDSVSKDGVEMAHQTGEVFSSVLPEIERSTSLVQEIATACREQANGSAQINSAVQRFNSSIQQFAALSEEISANSNNLSHQSEVLLGMLDYFKAKEM